MKSTITLLLTLTLAQLHAQLGTPILPNQFAGMVGYWDFEHSDALFQSTTGLGLDLIPAGTSGAITAIAGPGPGDSAIAKTTGRYLICNHGIAPNGGSATDVNKYSILIDFRVPDVSNWRCFYQTFPPNSNDGDLFINPSGHLGVAAVGYSSSIVKPNEWYRLVMTVDCGNSIVYYIDGQQWVPGAPDVLDGRFSLESDGVLLFADDDGEDGSMDVAKVVLFDRYLGSNEVFEMGGYGHNPDVSNAGASMNPYLQTPTTNSIYVSWHSAKTETPTVVYGTDSLHLSQIAYGTTQEINGNAGYRWHTVQLTGLEPNTEYFYKCYSGTDSTKTYFPFKTQALRNTPGQHFRFIVLGDNRTDIAQSTSQALNVRAKLIEKFGPDYHKYVNLICSVGDIVSNGSDVSQYINEYFTPFASLTKNIPSMISIGNHENNSSMFYEYMKYEDLTDNYPSTHPYNEKFYQLQLGSAQFLFLNANTSYRIAPQITWLSDRLNESDNNPDIDFVFSFTHQPGHSEVWPDGNENFVQNDIFDLLKQHPKCAFHFDGHSHNFERGVVEMVNADSSKQHDMRQMLSGGAGSALDRWGMYPNQTNYPEIQKSRDIYCWTLVDIDVDAKSYTCETYSFGNTSSPKANVPEDFVYRKINQPGPAKALAAGVVNAEKLVAFPMVGVDSALTCHFQVTSTPGNYNQPGLDRKQDVYDVYGDTGAPDWLPINLNAGLDIKRYAIKPGDGLAQGNTYAFRVRFRDHNLEWGPWSEEKTFVYDTTAQSAPCDFTADSLNVPVGYTVSFSDLSALPANAWQWDFNGDDVIDSHLQDPQYQYNTPGNYTVSLQINADSTGSSLTKNAYIHVYETVSVPTVKPDNFEVGIFPNPFATSTSIQFNLKKEQRLNVEISDISGKIVRRMYAGKLGKGPQTLSWDGKSEGGKKLPSGTYILHLKGDNINIGKKIVLK